MALSNKHQQFVAEYLKYWNATEAYRRTYPNASDITARKNGSMLLTNTDIAKAIQTHIDATTMGATEVLQRLGEQARAAYATYLLPDGSVDLDKMLSDGKGHLIKKIKPTKLGNEIEFYDAQTALINIGRHHKLFVDKQEVVADVTMQESEQAAERVLGRIESIASRLANQPKHD